MEKIKKVFSLGCVYTVLITVIFALIGTATEMTSPAIPLVQFLIITLCSFIVSATGEILHFEKIKPLYRYLIHFVVLWGSFMCIFYLTNKITTKGATGFFVSTVLFALAYGFAFLCLFLYRIVYKTYKKRSDNKTK